MLEKLSLLLPGPSTAHESDVESKGKDDVGAESPSARSIAYTFCKLPLESLICMYYDIVTGQLKDVRNVPILHRCLSHIMKNKKVFCKKHCPKHYRLPMHWTPDSCCHTDGDG
ncbi:hypothetical protein ROHU_008028 [Labeo rohita]|uniref:Uncharacterized protein n=1 Tax=Labeo rohita TaxID=84645 RepID=A0A498MEC7_LABRO|nr:hypothetical protein ROHU_008028 [Labeo rohita]